MNTAGTDGLPLTGERTVPGIPDENYWFRRHEAAYEFALSHVHGTVLEVGCGEGYGTALLARYATRVVGLDYDAVTIRHAARAYPAASFARANLAALPVLSNEIDLLTTLQVIEHVWDHVQFVGECRRVLRPGGRLLMTTPNRLTFSPGLDAPVNPFHTKEFDADELGDLLVACGLVVDQTLGLHAGDRLHELDRRHGGSFVAAQLGAGPDAWDDGLRADVHAVTTRDFEISPDDLAESLDLIALARRPG